MATPDFGGQTIRADVPVTPERAEIMQAVDAMDERLGMPPHGNLQPKDVARLGHIALPEGAISDNR